MTTISHKMVKKALFKDMKDHPELWRKPRKLKVVPTSSKNLKKFSEA